MISGSLRKMLTHLDSPVQYRLRIGDESIGLNDYIGQSISLHYLGQINCLNCNTRTPKSYSQGYCFRCCQALASCDMCMMRPALCHYDKGTCREPQWGLDTCMKPHIVYLANSSGLKVGITRQTQVPTRWMDQGASQAIPIFEVPARIYSGHVENLFKNHVSDRTHWQRMLKGTPELLDLKAERKKLIDLAQESLNKWQEEHQLPELVPVETEAVNITYPILEHPKKVKSLNFDKCPTVEGRLLGIKGQYLIFDTGVINIRKFGGYSVRFEG